MEATSHGSNLTADLADDAATWDALDQMFERMAGAPDVVVNAAGVFGMAAGHFETVRAFVTTRPDTVCVPLLRIERA